MQSNKESWSQRIDRYIAEGRTVSGGCGPSSAMKALNNSIASFSGTMVNEAKTIFGDASSMFNTITGSINKTIAGGPSQQGWGAAQSAAVTSSIIDAAATSGRNIKSAIGSVIGSIGGGNTVAPSGAMANVTASALENVENQKTQQQEQATVANYNQGNQNYWQAIGAGEKAPAMLDVANAANTNASKGLVTAQTSQASIDKANSWWQGPVLGAISAGASMIPGVGTQAPSTPAGSSSGWTGGSVGEQSDPALNQIQGSPLSSGPTQSDVAPPTWDPSWITG